jgi:hypothetical protein
MADTLTVNCSGIIKKTGNQCRRKCRIINPHGPNFCKDHKIEHKIENHARPAIPAGFYKLLKLYRSYRLRKRQISRQICANTTDFYTMDDISEIPDKFFISIKCETDGGIHYYGFDIRSINDLIENTRKSGNDIIINPYTRVPFTPANLEEIARMNKQLAAAMVDSGIDTETGLPRSPHLSNKFEMAAGIMRMTDEQLFNLRVVQIFGYMDELGFTTSTDWFTRLTRKQYVNYFEILRVFWLMRMTEESRENIVPPPNTRIFVPSLMTQWEIANRNRKIDRIRKILIDIIEILVHSVTNRDTRTQGAMVVLSALTYVSDEAAVANPALIGIFGTYRSYRRSGRRHYSTRYNPHVEIAEYGDDSPVDAGVAAAIRVVGEGPADEIGRRIIVTTHGGNILNVLQQNNPQIDTFIRNFYDNDRSGGLGSVSGSGLGSASDDQMNIDFSDIQIINMEDFIRYE